MIEMRREVERAHPDTAPAPQSVGARRLRRISVGLTQANRIGYTGRTLMRPKGRAPGAMSRCAQVEPKPMKETKGQRIYNRETYKRREKVPEGNSGDTGHGDALPIGKSAVPGRAGGFLEFVALPVV